MRQAFHIFLKDTRQFRLPILILLAWTALFAVLGSRPAMQIVAQIAVVDNATYVASWLAIYLFPFTWAYLIAQVIHAEALPGDRQYWLTRPYSRASLFGAKALFIFCYLLLPMMLAQAAIASVQGLPIRIYFPGLFWEQVLMTAAILLPIAAIAALTSTLAQFAIAALAVPVLFVASRAMPPWASFEWIRTSAGLVGMALAGALVLYVQFRWRRTRAARVAALCTILVVVATLPIFSWDGVFALQRAMVGSDDGLVRAELVKPPPPPSPDTRVSQPVARLIYRMSGPAEGTRIRCEAYAFSIEGPDGQVWRTGPLLVSAHYLLAEIADGCGTTVRVPRAFREAVAGRPVNIHASIYLTIFGKEEITTVPVGQRAVPVRNSGVCEGTPFDLILDGGKKRPMVRLDCRAAFRDPALGLVSINQDHGGSNKLFGQGRFSYSPFPAELRFHPIEYGSLNLPAADTLVIKTAKPVAHVRTTVDTIGVRLSDFEF
jgi:hypothetical protein